MFRRTIFVFLTAAIGAGCAPAAKTERRAASNDYQPRDQTGTGKLELIMATDAAADVLFVKPDPLQINKPSKVDSIVFYDSGGKVIHTLGPLPLRVLESSGWMYASPSELLPQALQSKIQEAQDVVVTIDGTKYDTDIDSGEPATHISFSGYGGCPNCLLEFMCTCLKPLYGVTAEVNYCPPMDKAWKCTRLP